MLKKLLLLSVITLSGLQATEEFNDLKTQEQAAETLEQIAQEQVVPAAIETQEIPAESIEIVNQIEGKKSAFELKKEEFKKLYAEKRSTICDLSRMNQDEVILQFHSIRNMDMLLRLKEAADKECSSAECNEAIREAYFELLEAHKGTDNMEVFELGKAALLHEIAFKLRR